MSKTTPQRVDLVPPGRSGWPTHRAFVVTSGKGGSEPIQHECGAVWPHKNGNGFDVVIHEGMSVHGRIVCVEIPWG